MVFYVLHTLLSCHLLTQPLDRTYYTSVNLIRPVIHNPFKLPLKTLFKLSGIRYPSLVSLTTFKTRGVVFNGLIGEK